MPIVETVPELRRKVAVTVVLIAASVTVAHLAPRPQPAYRMVDEVMADPARWEGAALIVHGYIAPGSLVALAPGAHTFVLTKRGARLAVYHEGLLPDTVRDQSEVVITGRLDRDGDGWSFASNRMSAKCGGKYEGARPLRALQFQ